MAKTLIGLSPTDPLGNSIRTSIWIWSPIVNYLEMNYEDLKDIIDVFKYDNVQVDISDKEAKELSQRMYDDIQKFKDYADDFNKLQDSLPDLDCQFCFGIGKERINVIQVSDDHCFKCYGKGKTRPMVCDYLVDVGFFYRLMDFLRYCGGFRNY